MFAIGRKYPRHHPEVMFPFCKYPCELWGIYGDASNKIDSH